MKPCAPRTPHDGSYRLLFSHPRMVEDLLRGFVAEEWIERLDFSTLERLNSAHVSDGLERREGDLGWRLRMQDAPVYVYLLVEFQSEVQRFMALRQSVYLGLFYQQLVKLGELTPDRRLPLVLPVVVYNGKVGWSLVELKEFRAMLIERVEEWNREIEARGEKRGLRKGLKKGLEQGRQEGRALLLRLLETKFGPVDARTQSRVHAAGPDRLLEWAERLLNAERLADVFRR